MLLKNLDDTSAFGRFLGSILEPSDIVALVGDLGTGKTTLTQSIAKGMDIEEDVSSATFTLLNEYNGSLPMYHFDTYRLDDPIEFLAIGAEDYLNGEGVSVIEWADRVLDFLPEDYLLLNLSYVSEHEREVSYKGVGTRGEALAKEVKRYEDTCL